MQPRKLNKHTILISIFIIFSEIRTPEDVRKIIKTAKLHESELTDTSQILRFPAPSQQNDNLRLMLLDDTLLKEIEAGNELIFKGKKLTCPMQCNRCTTSRAQKKGDRGFESRH